MKNIFISYRREDSEGFARGLFQTLAGIFGDDRVFMDVEAIGLGTDFVEAIEKSLAGCGALLVLIGKDWLTCTDASGQRRLDDPNDFVRMEVAKALEQNVRVIPVLVKGAKMPPAEALPEDLRSIARRQALELRHERWRQDVDHLASALAGLLELERLDRGKPEPPPGPAKPRKSMVRRLAAVAAAAVLAVAGYALLGEKPDTPPGVFEPEPEPSLPSPGPTPDPEPPPGPAPKLPTAVDLTGLWVDDDGVNVQISLQGDQVVSQSFNPLTGLAINAVWQVNGRNIAFNWASSAGNQGYGEGTIAGDGNAIDYRYLDHVTGEQGYGRLLRVVQ